MSNESYQYTNNWFESAAKGVWDTLIPQINPARILEIGSYEGAATCYLIEKLAASKEIELHPANKTMKPIIIKDKECEIRGLMVGLIRTY